MRRGLSIFLILFFGLGPLAAALPAGDESRLPPCCRRHGAHHCAMAMRMAAQAASGKHAFTAPSHCPSFPGYPAASTAPVHALAASLASLPALPSQAHSITASRDAAPSGQIRTRASRGPPAVRIG
jgi:hypothetical protein